MPLYENAESREKEDAVAAAFAKRYDLEWQRSPDENAVPDHFFAGYGQDGLGEAFMIVSETKRRDYDFGKKHEDFFIDLKKVKDLLRFFPVEGLIIVGFNDLFASVNLHRVKPYKIEKGGRYDRGDRWDIDIMAHFRWSDFNVHGKRMEFYYP